MCSHECPVKSQANKFSRDVLLKAAQVVIEGRKVGTAGDRDGKSEVLTSAFETRFRLVQEIIEAQPVFERHAACSVQVDLLGICLAAVIGLSGWLGYKAWGLYERGRLGWKNVGLGLGILTAVGAIEGVFGG